MHLRVRPGGRRVDVSITPIVRLERLGSALVAPNDGVNFNILRFVYYLR